MNKKEILFLIIISLFLTPIVFAETRENWSGYIELKLDKNNFNLSEEITGKVIITNLETFPINDNKLIFHIAQGDYEYPSHFSINENIVYQKVIDKIWASSNSIRTINFNLPNPGAGKYRVDTYSEIGKSELYGLNSTLLSPFSESFIVEGKEEIRVLINREKSYIGDFVFGQNLATIDPSQNILGKLVIKNESAGSKQGLKLITTMCNWDYSYCEKNNEKIIDVGTINSNSEKEIALSLIAPTIPSIYEINYKLISGEKIESIYKSRILVIGENAIIKKAYIEGVENEDYFVNTIISFINPDKNYNAKKLNLNLKIFKSDLKLEEQKKEIINLNEEFISEKLKISSKDFDKICLELKKENETVDKECLIINLKELKEEYKKLNPEQVKVSWNYNEQKEEITINLNKSVINANVIITSREELLFEESISKKQGEYTIKIPYPKINGLLIIDDLDAKRQQLFNLILDKETDLRLTGEVTIENEKIICGENLCNEDETCEGKGYEALGGVCCSKNCVPLASYNSNQNIPLIFITALIILIITIFIVRSTMKGVRK